MRFATGLPGVNLYPPVTRDWERSMGPEDFQLVARTADEIGFDCISLSEHIVMPTDLAELMGPFWSHAMTAMAFVAGATSRIEVDSAVIVLPYHHPVVLAKAVSTLDLLSGGRVRLSVGVGHAEREFEVLGVPYQERGRRTDEYLAAMVELWTEEKPTFHGRYVEFDDVVFEPKPVRRPHPPIIVGGNSEAAMRRAARHDGWFPWLITADRLGSCLDHIRSLPEFEARTRPFEVVMPLTTLAVDEEHRPISDDGRRAAPRGAQETIDAIGRLGEIGVTQTMVPMPPARSLAEHLDGLRWIADEIIPVFR